MRKHLNDTMSTASPDIAKEINFVFDSSSAGTGAKFQVQDTRHQLR